MYSYVSKQAENGCSFTLYVCHRRLAEWRIIVNEVLETIAKALVENPDDVSVTEVQGEQSVILELRVNKDDMGKVIGKQGRIAKAIRTVVKAAASREDKHVVVEII